MKNTEDNLALRILQILKTGRENAITAERIASKFDYKDTRKVRLAIEALIDDYIPVLSSPSPPYGYFLPANQAEIDECVAVLQSYGRNIFDRANKIKNAKRKQIQLSLGV